VTSYDPSSSTGGAALRRCIARDVCEFAQQNWGRAPLLSRAAELGGDFTDLLDAAAVDELVSRRGLRTPFLRMAKEGAVLPAGRFTRGGGAGAGITDQVADDKVLEQLDDGATLVLQALHRTWPPLVDFGAALASDVGHPVQINAYITPAQNRGFAPHYDVHDVFVLQLSGRKRWTIHAPVVMDPLENQPWEQHRDAVAKRAAEDEALIDVVLEPGDALYLPRGTIHAADALGETSIHLTVGVHPLTRFDLVQHLLQLAQQDAGLRASLPMNAQLGEGTVLEPHLTATVATLRDFLATASVDEIARRVSDSLMARTRPEPLGPLGQLAAAEALRHSTSLRLRAGLRFRLEPDGERIKLVLLGRTVFLPAHAGEALKAVLGGTDFTPAELPALDDADQLMVARRLIREGVVVPA
jgi:lysine-specific demethylase/histidyl-hydroxylase NO66